MPTFCCIIIRTELPPLTKSSGVQVHAQNNIPDEWLQFCLSEFCNPQFIVAYRGGHRCPSTVLKLVDKTLMPVAEHAQAPNSGVSIHTRPDWDGIAYCRCNNTLSGDYVPRLLKCVGFARALPSTQPEKAPLGPVLYVHTTGKFTGFLAGHGAWQYGLLSGALIFL